MKEQISKTECGQHRILGYAYNDYFIMVCRGCGLEPEMHETNAETIARNEKAGA